ncbi:hypothetical protein HEMA109418_01085 [Helcobacillus massiliensis]
MVDEQRLRRRASAPRRLALLFDGHHLLTSQVRALVLMGLGLPLASLAVDPEIMDSRLQNGGLGIWFAAGLAIVLSCAMAGVGSLVRRAGGAGPARSAAPRAPRAASIVRPWQRR